MRGQNKLILMEKSINKLEKINVVGDRVLVKPRKESERTDSGLYLPPGVREKEKIQSLDMESAYQKIIKDYDN